MCETAQHITLKSGSSLDRAFGILDCICYLAKYDNDHPYQGRGLARVKDETKIFVKNLDIRYLYGWWNWCVDVSREHGCVTSEPSSV